MVRRSSKAFGHIVDPTWESDRINVRVVGAWCIITAVAEPAVAEPAQPIGVGVRLCVFKLWKEGVSSSLLTRGRMVPLQNLIRTIKRVSCNHTELLRELGDTLVVSSIVFAILVIDLVVWLFGDVDEASVLRVVEIQIPCW